MATMFNSFAPYSADKGQYTSTIFMSAQDRLEEIKVELKTMDCQEDVDANDQWSWPNLSLAGYKEVIMYVKKEGSDELHSELVGIPMSPLEDGLVIFRFDGDSFGGEIGKYVGLVEVRYGRSDLSGDKIVTAGNLIPFEVREDFYCDPFDEYFTECAGGN